MKCKECDACVKQRNEYICTGIKEPFVIDNIEMECSEYSQSKVMKHKYLRELFLDDKLPFPFGEEDYHDFDERDTFSMDYTLIAWIYECLRFFKEETPIDLTYHIFNIDDEELTQIQCIDGMIEDCKIVLLNNGTFGSQFAKVDAAKDDLFKVLSKVYWAMWW